MPRLTYRAHTSSVEAHKVKLFSDGGELVIRHKERFFELVIVMFSFSLVGGAYIQQRTRVDTALVIILLQCSLL